MVYVTQEQAGKNLLPATRYGELSVLLTESNNIGFSAGFVCNALRSKLSRFCDDDYLLLIGDPVVIGIAVATAAQWNQGRVKMLKWDRQEHCYYPVTINLYQKEESNGLTE